MAAAAGPAGRARAGAIAEARIGAELKAAQERGEVATQERKASTVRSADGAPASHSEIGIPRQRASEMKKLADAGEQKIREEVAAATREGRRGTGYGRLGGDAFTFSFAPS